MAKKRFNAQVESFVSDYKDRLLAVAKDATMQVIEEAQQPVGKGGNMRVDTGFLRLTGQVRLNGLPFGPSRIEDGFPPEQDVTLTLGTAKLGDDIFFGWTANYARAREAKDGFLGLATQKWQQFVDKSVNKLRSRLGR